MDIRKKQEILEEYCSNEMQKLKQLCHAKICRIGGICQMDYDDFYSIALDVLRDSVEKFDDRKTYRFHAFLSGNIQRRFHTEIRDRNRGKQIPRTQIDYIYAPVEEGNSIEEKLPSGFVIERELPEEFGISPDGRVEKYLDSLSLTQRNIAELIMRGYTPFEIRETLGLTEKEYSVSLVGMRAHEKSKYLYRDSETESARGNEEEEKMREITVTSEKTKQTSYAISAICKKLSRHQIRDNHVLQRKSGQWNNLFKSELMSDILQGRALTQIIISEEMKDGITMRWLIDGLQRCTNIEDFVNDRFSVSKNVQVYDIQYQTEKRDRDGNVMYHSDGFPIPEIKSFDIRGKKFSQLPEELQDKFLEYQVPVLLNLNCTKKEIAYDIARFNRCRPMTVAQNGWTGLNEGYAEFVDNILKMDFFSVDYKYSDYRLNSGKSGMMRRMIVESIMAINYLNDFNKDFGKMCRYLSEHANDAVFIEFYDLVERLMDIADDALTHAFCIKDSFLYFALFDRFTKNCKEDRRFTAFVREFNRSLHNKKIDGVSFDELNDKSTKDRAVIIRKLCHLEGLMLEYLQFDEKVR